MDGVLQQLLVEGASDTELDAQCCDSCRTHRGCGSWVREKQVVEAAFAAWLLNLLFWCQVHFFYYENEWDAAVVYFRAQVNDIFGSCVSGFSPVCTERASA